MIICRAPINIAIIKYWGKLEGFESENVANNPSLSVTLDIDHVFTETKVHVSPGDGQVLFKLNNTLQEPTKRMKKVLSKFPTHEKKIFIESVNNFPTGAGMASSASGMAALVLALDKALNTNYEGKALCEIARLGSGSACRSVYGGFVEWNGNSVEQVFTANHWPELRCLLLITNGEEKRFPSTTAMQTTVETSDLYSLRREIAIKRIGCLKRSIEEKDFSSFAKICMQESNQLHALCLDSFPPIHYLNDKAFAIMDRIHEMNRECTIAAYTFDAGPNAFIFCLEENLFKVREGLRGFGEMIECRVGDGPIVTCTD